MSSNVSALQVVPNDPLQRFRDKINAQNLEARNLAKNEVQDFSEAMDGGAEAKQRELSQLQSDLREFDREYIEFRENLVQKIKQRETIIEAVKAANDVLNRPILEAGELEGAENGRKVKRQRG